MIVSGLSKLFVESAVQSVSVNHFDGNLIFNREPDRISKNRVAFTLRVKDSHGPGHRMGAEHPWVGHKPRHMVAACFHAYTHVIEFLLQSGATRISSKFRTFLPADMDRWQEVAMSVYNVNAGSQMMPQRYGTLCECDYILPGSVEPKVTIMRQADIQKCPFMIMVPEHYRADGSCKCNDAEHREYMKKNWEYIEDDFKKLGITV